MGGCSAEFCNNSSKKGYVMRIFPRDPERRASWTKNVGRKNWTPTNNTYLCEVHFTPDMWEQRADGKRKLKPNAVPTIFGFFLKKDTAKNNNINNNILNNNVSENQLNNKNQDMEYETITNTESSSLVKNNVSDNVLNNDVSDNQLNNKNQDMEYETITNTESSSLVKNNVSDNVLNNDISDNQLNNKNQDMEYETITNTPESSSLAKNNISDNVLNNDVSDNQLNKNQDMEYETIIKKQYLQIINMRRKMKALRRTIGTLQTKHNNKYKASLYSIFTDDQIQALFTKKRSIRNWSYETIYRALRLKLACGNNGYKHLIQQGYPLPSLQTLRRLEDFKF